MAGKLIASGNAKKYSHKVHQTFLRWEAVGKVHIYSNYVFRKINPDLVLTSLIYFTKLAEVTHI